MNKRNDRRDTDFQSVRSVWGFGFRSHGLQIRVTAMLALFICAFVASMSQAADAVKPPNVVLIISDDQAWGDYGFMGHEHVQTPNLDKLSKESLTFKRGYVPSSLCCPSLASLITGQYAHQHRITSNDPPGTAGAKGRETPAFLAGREKLNRFMDEAPSLPRLLQTKGYLSFQAGKWWQGEFKHGGFTHGMTTKGSRHGDEGLTIGRQTMEPVFEFLDEAKKEQKPFMVWYAPMMPHTPHNPPKRLVEKYKYKTPSIHVAKYWAMIEWFDETVGQLLERLDKDGVADNTIVIFLADNGWIQKPDETGYAERSKRSPYEGGIRTPIMVRWTGKVKPRMSDDLAFSLDITPTILKAAALEPGMSMPGLNLLDESALKKRPGLFGECFSHDAVDLDHPAASLEYRWAISGQWKLIAPHAPNQTNHAPELYNLSNDPAERTNLAAKEPERVAELMKRLDAWWTPEVAK